MNLIFFNEVPISNTGIPIFIPAFLSFFGAGDYAAVVVRQHHYRLPFQRRIEDSLAGSVEIIAIDEGEDL